jgi:isopenicillin-N epimerase
MRKSREALGAFLHAKPENLCFVTNATYAVNVIAQSLGKSYLQPGDEILATDHEYGACKRAWIEHAVTKGAVWVEA